ncbi:MAG: rhomboid family intramembrane serine protease [Bradymonadia bacterium]
MSTPPHEQYEVKPISGLGGSALGAIAAALGFVAVLGEAGLTRALRTPWIFWLLTLLVVSWLLADRAQKLRRRGDAVRLDDHALTLPSALTGGAAVILEYSEIVALSIAERGGEEILLVHAPGRRFALASARFVDARAVGSLARALLARTRGLTEAQAHLTVTSVQQAVSALPDPPPLRATPALLVSMSAVSLWVLYGLAPDEGSAALLWGANARSLLEGGQWFRLATASFVHADMLHLIMNMLALWSLGRPLERLLGAPAIFSVALFAGWMGALVSALGNADGVSVGASTAVFGLFGALAVLQIRFGARMPAHMRPSRAFWIQTIGLNAALLIVLPRLDHWGHFGGLVGGALATWLLDLSPLAPRSLRSLRVRTLAFALIALHLAGLVTASGRTRDDRAADAETLQRSRRSASS